MAVSCCVLVRVLLGRTNFIIFLIIFAVGGIAYRLLAAVPDDRVNRQYVGDIPGRRGNIIVLPGMHEYRIGLLPLCEDQQIL
jgi:hypothetical protein